jgi:hypothetical protein
MVAPVRPGPRACRSFTGFEHGPVRTPRIRPALLKRRRLLPALLVAVTFGGTAPAAANAPPARRQVAATEFSFALSAGFERRRMDATLAVKR